MAPDRVALAAAEDWGLSQFWYDEATSRLLAGELLERAAAARAARGGGDVVVCCLSAPSAFKALLAAGPPPWLTARLFEFDARFAAFGERFVRYDYNEPLAFPRELAGAADVLILDPPFLNRDCLAGFAATVDALRRRPPQGEEGGDASSVMLCSGAVMLAPARALLGVRPTRAHVGHANRLSNPFSLYVSYDERGRLGGVDVEAEAADASGGGGGGGGDGGDGAMTAEAQ